MLLSLLSGGDVVQKGCRSFASAGRVFFGVCSMMEDWRVCARIVHTYTYIAAD